MNLKNICPIVPSILSTTNAFVALNPWPPLRLKSMTSDFHHCYLKNVDDINSGNCCHCSSICLGKKGKNLLHLNLLFQKRFMQKNCKNILQKNHKHLLDLTSYCYFTLLCTSIFFL